MFATVACGICDVSAPGRADMPSANLTPASGRQDHTTSPYAAIVSRPRAVDRSRIQRTHPAIPSRAKRCRVHRIPPRVRDDRDTPLCGTGWRELVEMICPTGEAKYFCREDSTPNGPTGKSREDPSDQKVRALAVNRKHGSGLAAYADTRERKTANTVLL